MNAIKRPRIKPPLYRIGDFVAVVYQGAELYRGAVLHVSARGRHWDDERYYKVATPHAELTFAESALALLSRH